MISASPQDVASSAKEGVTNNKSARKTQGLEGGTKTNKDTVDHQNPATGVNNLADTAL